MVTAAPTFHVISSAKVKSVIDQNRNRVFDAVKTAYRLLVTGDATNPDSYFLRYLDKPSEWRTDAAMA